EIAFFLGKLLAERLNAATTYLVDLKRQLEGQGNHFGMVGEILETLIHHQHEEFMPARKVRPIRDSEPIRNRFQPRHRPLERVAEAGKLIARGGKPQRLARVGIDDDVGRPSAKLVPGIENPGGPDAIDPRAILYEG
ncbi:MAG TPA: hypothetical protein VN808_15655, partial [Stellaceae bacterium]|nr:hypothetical protein [Stellaceae bacterium]